MLFSPTLQGVFTSQPLSVRGSFPLSRKHKGSCLCPDQAKALNTPVKRLQKKVHLVAHPVGCGSNVWRKAPKAIVPAGSARSAVSCLLPPLWSESPSCSDRCGGWMWQAGPFAAPGRSTGADNMWRCFHWLRLDKRQNLLLVHLVPCAPVIAGVGTTGSHAMPGGDLLGCTSPSQAFLLFWT